MALLVQMMQSQSVSCASVIPSGPVPAVGFQSQFQPSCVAATRESEHTQFHACATAVTQRYMRRELTVGPVPEDAM